MQQRQSPLGSDSEVLPAGAASRLNVTSIPSWVEHAPFESGAGADDKFVTGGACLLLKDHQIDLSGQSIAYHTRVLWRVVTTAGAAGVAQLSLAFDPVLQHLDIHTVRIHRDGQVLEHARREAFALMRREQNLERQMLDGRLTAAMIIPDVRPGDVVEYCWTMYGDNPVLRSCFSDWIAFSGPAMVLHERLRAPVGRAIALKYFGDIPGETVEEANGFIERRWKMERVEAARLEEFTPPWRYLSRTIQFSEAQDWAEVSRLFAMRYEPEDIPSVLRDEAERITAMHSDPVARMMEALATVQGRLRYLALSLGEGGLVPRQLETIWSTGYGDCKDASCVFVALCRLCGLDAAPALVSTRYGPALNEWLPSPTVFDHCIARVTIGERRYWIDPTLRSQPRKAELLINHHLGSALPIVPEGAALEDMGVPKERLMLDVSEELTFGKKVSSPAKLNVRMTFGAQRGEAMREAIANQGLSELAEQLRRRYLNEWSRITESEPLEIKEDEDAATVTLTGRYVIEQPWRDNGADRVICNIVNHDVTNDLGSLPNEADRKNEIHLAFPRIVRRHADVKLPVDLIFAETDVAEQISGAKYTEKILRYEPRWITIDQILTVNSPVAPASEAKGYAEMARRINGRPVLTLTLPISGDKFAKTQKRSGWWIVAAIWAIVSLVSMLSRIPSNDTWNAGTTGPYEMGSAPSPDNNTSSNAPSTNNLGVKDRWGILKGDAPQDNGGGTVEPTKSPDQKPE